jgi:hypothetical protein
MGVSFNGLTVRVLYDLHVKKMVLLYAYGIKTDGRRQFISFRLAKSESRANYLSLFSLGGSKIQFIEKQRAKIHDFLKSGDCVFFCPPEPEGQIFEHGFITL